MISKDFDCDYIGSCIYADKIDLLEIWDDDI